MQRRSEVQIHGGDCCVVTSTSLNDLAAAVSLTLDDTPIPVTAENMLLLGDDEYGAEPGTSAFIYLVGPLPVSTGDHTLESSIGWLPDGTAINDTGRSICEMDFTMPASP